MFTFLSEEIVEIAHNDDLPQFLRDVDGAGGLSEEDKRFIGYYNLQNPYKNAKNEVQRFDYISQLNEALIKRRDLPIYSFW